MEKKDFSGPKDTDLNSGDGSSEQPQVQLEEVDTVTGLPKEALIPTEQRGKPMPIKPLQADPEYDNTLAETQTLLNKSESFVVPKLKYLYGDQGFDFEEADYLGQKK